MASPFSADIAHGKKVGRKLTTLFVFGAAINFLPTYWVTQALAVFGMFCFLYFFVLKGLDRISFGEHLFRAQGCGATLLRQDDGDLKTIAFSPEAFEKFMQETRKSSFWW